jgi:hypothetical protein
MVDAERELAIQLGELGALNPLRLGSKPAAHNFASHTITSPRDVEPRAGVSWLDGVMVKWLAGENTGRVSVSPPIATESIKLVCGEV